MGADVTDNRFKDYPIDARFPGAGVDVRFQNWPVDGRFFGGLDTRFEGSVYGGVLPYGYAVLAIGGNPVVDADGNVYIVREDALQ